MKLSEFLDRVKLQNPNLGQQAVDDNFLTTLINQAVDQVNLLTQVYKTYTDFNLEADKRVYDLSTVAPLYLGRDKRGLYLYIDSNWEKITPRPESWIAKNYPDYLNDSSVTLPIYYYIEGNELGFYPPCNDDITNGCRLYHLKKSSPMSTGDHYPWTGNTTEITALLPLDDAIIAYVRWKLSPQFGVSTDVDLRKVEFIEECRKGTLQINRKPDQTNDVDQGMTA